MALHPGGLRNLQRRLRCLYHLGYLDRPPEQSNAGLSDSHLVYGLGPKAAALLDSYDERSIKRLRTAKPNISHALMISQFHTVLHLALKKHGGMITRWSQGYELKDMLAVRGRKAELVPDAFFSIEDGDDRWNFFLEADRSTMPTNRILDKMKIYWQWSRNQTHQNILDITRFRVLTITLSPQRKENLRRITRNADTRQEGSNMYLFATEKDYSLKNPEAVLQAIWSSPKGGEPHMILE